MGQCSGESAFCTAQSREGKPDVESGTNFPADNSA